MAASGGLKITIKAPGLVPNFTATKLRNLKKFVFGQIALAWHKTFRMAKFTPTGARRYNYMKRKTKDIFTGSITRDMGRFGPISGDPLVWSGTTRANTTQANIEARSTRSSARYPGARQLNQKPPGFPRGQMAFEFRKVLPSDERKLGKMAERLLRSRFSRGKRQITVSS